MTAEIIIHRLNKAKDTLTVEVGEESREYRLKGKRIIINPNRGLLASGLLTLGERETVSCRVYAVWIKGHMYYQTLSGPVEENGEEVRYVGPEFLVGNRPSRSIKNRLRINFAAFNETMTLARQAAGQNSDS